MTMKLKRIVLLIAVCLQALSLAAAPRIVRPGVKSPTTFAIFIDSRSYEAAAAEVDAYRAAVERDGLGTYLLIDEWQNPESVRSEIIRMTEAQPHLEGVVFVGDIPIAMIRDGQHLTSAFKSSQDRDWKDSSVPSDRYYDDPELQFEFLRRDADEPLYFYYSLSPESRQHIASPIYSARIKPPKREGADSDELLRAYLRKVVKAHAEQNELDNLFVFRGHGYNSEAPEAWAGEQIALREQLPALFRTGSTVRFYDFESRWPMKPYLLEKMARKGVDVALCHHHGAPDTQYLNGYRNGSGMNVSIENIKRFLRSKIDGHKDPEKRKAELIAYYGVPEAWCQLSDSLHTADSLLDQAMDVHIEDLYNRPMNPRMVMFDACYNGSFHLDECIAASYIFGPGDCIVTQGNSVNALQDKWPDRYIGLLDCGVRIGQWGRHVHYLETHLIGDPTYRFINRALPGTDLNTALTAKASDNKYVVVCLHIPSTCEEQDRKQFRYDRAGSTMTNHRGLYEILKPYRAHIISGHTHTTFNQSIAPGLYEHVTPALSGAWWQGPLCTDGTPAGYGVYEVNGDRIDWYYKSTGYPADYQMKIYSGREYPQFEGYAVANVWASDPAWEVEFTIDGVPVGPAERFQAYDPAAKQLYSDTSQMDHKWIYPSISDHYYRVALPEGAKRVEVSATDRFGRISRAAVDLK